MNILATIGTVDPSLQYADRPTVKVVVKKDDQLIILNEGLLPGGGIDPGESDQDAIRRELQEELVITLRDTHEIGTVVQYRILINKKYLISGYTAELETTGGPTNPQDEREARIITRWLTLDEAMIYVSGSIDKVKLKPMDDADNQSKLYNLMTTFELLKSLNSKLSQ